MSIETVEVTKLLVNFKTGSFENVTEYADVRLEDGMSTAQWLQKKQTTLDPAQWGGDLEVRL